MKTKLVAATAAGGVVLVLVTACGGARSTVGTPVAAGPSTTAGAAPTATAAAPALEAGKIGDAFPFDTSKATGQVTLASAVRVVPAAGRAFLPKSGSWLVVEVRLRLTRDKAPYGFLVDSFNFTLRDRDGKRHANDITGPDTILSDVLAAGGQVSGKLAFDLPKGTYSLSWAPVLGRGDLVRWQIDK